MELVALGICIIAAFTYGSEMVIQERKLPDTSPIVITFFFACGVMIYGLPTVTAEILFGEIVWPSGWEWALLFILPILAFMADWAHFAAIHARAGSILLATMYMAIPMFASALRLEVPPLMRVLAWTLTSIAIVVLVRGKIFYEAEAALEKNSKRKLNMVAACTSILATFLYAAEVVTQDHFLRHVSSTVLATVGGLATAVYAGIVIILRHASGGTLHYPKRKDWLWVVVIPILSFTADLAHFGALHVKVGSTTLAMFYMTCPVWASVISWQRPTKWHIVAWIFAASGVITLSL